MNITVQMITASYLTSLEEGGGIEIIGRFDNDVGALRFCEINKPAVILLDYEIEKANTELFIQSLLNESPESRVILLGEKLSDEVVLSCLVSVIYGYLEWQEVEHVLYKAICSVGRGEAWVSRRLVGLLLERFRG